jgi:DNA-binding response OmpR family regulator
MNHAILLVSGNNPVSQRHKAHLEQAGYSVHIARNVFEAEVELRTTLFSLVITDLRMWDSDLTEGLKVIERVRTLRMGMPILALASSGDLGLHRKARELGVFDVIAEDTPLVDLVFLIANLLHEMYNPSAAFAPPPSNGGTLPNATAGHMARPRHAKKLVPGSE